MPRAANRQPVLKPQDFYLLLAFAALGDDVMTYPELAALSGLSMSEVHAALKRAAASRLLFFDGKRPRLLVPAFKEFLLHGAQYAFPAARGSMVVGIPAARAAAPLNARIVPSADSPPVWPALEGSLRGVALMPLYRPLPLPRNGVRRCTRTWLCSMPCVSVAREIASWRVKRSRPGCDFG
jgi:hypothetical protein